MACLRIPGRRSENLRIAPSHTRPPLPDINRSVDTIHPVHSTQAHLMSNTKLRSTLALLAGLACAPSAFADFSRMYIHIVGPSAMIPLAKAVGNSLEKSRKLKQLPKLEATGTSGSVTLFCEGASNESPDILAIARPLKKKEFEGCRDHGVRDIVEIRLGYDALVFAQAKQPGSIALSRTDLHQALSQYAANPQGKPAPNTRMTWKDVNPVLPERKIEVLGPPLLSGTAETLVDVIATTPACKPGTTPPEALKSCRQLRQDGVYREFREHDDGVISELVLNPQRIGVLDYKLYRDNAKKLDLIPLEGVKPEADTLANQTYPATRPLYLYVKSAQVDRIPGLNAYLNEWVQEKTWGDKGYLVSLGLTPQSKTDRDSQARKLKTLEPMTSPIE